jgi:universal stress protein E
VTTRPDPAAARPRRLLVVVDPAARAQPALEKAARLARAFKARVELYACDFREGLDGPGRAFAAARRRLVEAGESQLRRLAHEYLGDGQSEVRYELGHPRAERILARVRRSRPDLVVLDSHFHAGARRALFGPADWPLVRDCPVPLLYAKPGRWHAAPRIAAAVDPLHPADPRARLDAAIVGRARSLARGLKGTLRVVHAWLPLEPALAGPGLLGLPVGAPAAVERLLADAEGRAARAVASLCRGGRGPRASAVLLRGAAVETLPGFAELEGLDVLALGAVSRGRLYETLVGATAERLLERVPCDLLVVKARRVAAARPRAGRHGVRRRIPV